MTKIPIEKVMEEEREPSLEMGSKENDDINTAKEVKAGVEQRFEEIPEASSANTPTVANESIKNSSEEESVEDFESESEDEYDYDSEDDFDDSESEGRCVTPKKTLLQLAQEAVIKTLSKAVDGEEVTARYCCGGSIPPKEEPSKVSESKFEEKAKDGEEKVGEKSKGEKSQKDGFKDRAPKDEDCCRQKIIKAVEGPNDVKEPRLVEASASEDIRSRTQLPALTIRWDDPMDSKMTRRLTLATGDRQDSSKPLRRLVMACRDGGLDQSKFTIDFHPQDHSILDSVAQILLPGWKGSLLSKFPEHRGVKVEEGRLHAFPADVQSEIRLNPKSQHLGRLIVCLPSLFEGGELKISSDGHESFFDWSSSENPGMNWIALTKDCKLEHSPVTEGTQILLIYDLVVTKRVGDGVGSGQVVDPKLSPLYRGIKDMLLEPGFMKTGGSLGYYCRYPYSHTNHEMGKRLPLALKGVDMVFYSVFKSLGLKPEVRPIIDPVDLDMIYENQFEEMFGDGCDEDEYEEWMGERRSREHCKVGNAFHELRMGNYPSPYDEEYDGDFDENLACYWPLKEKSGVTWLNTPRSNGKKPRELAVVMEQDKGEDMFCCYECRNYHHVERIHSLVGMLVTIPKFSERHLEI